MLNSKHRRLNKNNIKKLGSLTIITALLTVSGCGVTVDDRDKAGEVTERELVVSVEAETGAFSGNAKVASELSGYSGDGYVDGLQEDGDKVDITLDIKKEGFYDLDVICSATGGYKENYILVDGEAVGTISRDREKFEAVTVPRVYMSMGEHDVSIEKYWGYMNIDKIDVMTSLPFDESIYTEVTPDLIDENASPNAKRVYKYLLDNYGKNTISGQYSSEGAFGHEMAVIWKETGKFPAMVGLDMIEYSPSRVENGSIGNSIDWAIEAWDNNSLVTMCWHWNAPSKYITGNWYSAFYADSTNINLDNIMNGKDEEGYNLLVSDMDAIAGELTKLRDADVPVLWRPLHEASGGWFWWGDCKPESYLKLYNLMYDKFVNEYELHNLIWVWNGQDAKWYPGDDKVDIIGTDIYPGNHVYTSQYPKFVECVNAQQEYDGGTDDTTGEADQEKDKDKDTNSSGKPHKIITLSENGCIPDPDLLVRDRAMWSYIGTWSGEFVSDNGGFNVFSEEYTEADMLAKFYNHENVITRDELPDLKTYGD